MLSVLKCISTIREVSSLKKLPIGISDFKELIENDYLFVDTSLFVEEVFREAAKCTLITRPRRFGKTLNMSMLRYFFDNTLDSFTLFKPLNIGKNTEVMQQLNNYPTIFITFKDVKNLNWYATKVQLKSLISKLYDDLYPSIKKGLKSSVERKSYETIRNKTAKTPEYKSSLKFLTELLHRVYNKPVLLLIDEYDAPILSGWINGYYDNVIDFMKGFLSDGLKDNPFIFKGILTGIYRVSKESVFSGLNNLKVYSVFDEKYAPYFGFTDSDIDYLIKALAITPKTSIKENLKTWYKGYNVGSSVQYNPWSVIRYLDEGKLKAYWINTSSNDLIRENIHRNMERKSEFREEITQLLKGNRIKKVIDDSACLNDLNTKTEAIWTLFIFSGYLKPQSQVLKNAKYECELVIPNKEILVFFQDTVMEWLKHPHIVKPAAASNRTHTTPQEASYLIYDSFSYKDMRKGNNHHLPYSIPWDIRTSHWWLLDKIKQKRWSGEG